MTDIERQIYQHIVDQFLFGEPSDDLTVDASLLDMGTLDSTGVLELAAFVEDTFGVQVADEDMVPDNFDSIGALARYVDRRKRVTA